MSSGFMGTPAIEEDFEATRGTISADSRDFERPRQSFYANTYPQSMGNNIDDSNYFLDSAWESIKDTAKNVVTEVSSWISDDKKEEPKKEEPKKQEITDEEKDLEKLKKPEVKKETTETEVTKSQIISSFQDYLKKSHPIIGSTYSGPTDGKMNPQLINAAKQVESILASAVNKFDDLNRGDRIKGKIYNPTNDSFFTNTSDIDNAINLIIKFQSSKKDNEIQKKDANLSRKEKLLSFYKKIK